MSTGWTAFIVALAAFNILGCAWLLWWTSKRRPGDPKPEETSHYWDGDITEYNKPMPRWWINWFYLMIAFGIGYLAWYGGLGGRSEEHTSELQSLMRISYAVFCLKKKNKQTIYTKLYYELQS